VLQEPFGVSLGVCALAFCQVWVRLPFVSARGEFSKSKRAENWLQQSSTEHHETSGGRWKIVCGHVILGAIAECFMRGEFSKSK
jgi:hypothetical protein